MISVIYNCLGDFMVISRGPKMDPWGMSFVIEFDSD